MRKTRKLAISIMSFVFVIAVGLLGVIAFNSNKVFYADALTFVNYKETYTLGETVTIQSAEFEYKGKTYKANAVVRFPNGDSYKYDELVLEKPGNYYVDYSAVADDNTLLKETKSFTVLANIYTFDGAGEYEYGSNSYLEEDVKGLNVTLGRNSTLTINTPIDVSNLTKDDSILKFYITPNQKQTVEVGALYVRLTDVHDKDKYVELQYRTLSDTANFHYVFASANDQFLTGLNQTSSPTKDSVEYDGFYYNLSHNNTKNGKGHTSRASFTGVVDTNNKEKIISKYFPNNAEYTEQELFYYNALEVRMDYAQKRVYSQPDGVYAISRCILADFDDERTLGGKAPWEGFTTGEVFVSIYAKDYTSTDFNFFITEVYGQDVSTLTMKNELAPRLSVDTQDYDVENLPNAIVGKKYNLFDAVAFDDVDGEVKVSVKAYNSIGATFAVADNSFVPTQAGVYTIEYSAVDSFGNKTAKTFKVKAVTRQSINYEFSAGETQFSAGEVVSVKELTLLNPSNLYDLKITAKNSAQNVEYEIDNDELQFVPSYAGTYTITYLYTDYCSEQAITYDIVVNSSNLVVFEEDITLPKYVIKGLEYPVAKMYGYSFVNGTQRQESSLYIKEGETGAERLITSDTYAVQSDVTSVNLIYKIGQAQKTYQIPVVNAVSVDNEGYKVDLSKYFYNTAGTFKSESNSKKIQFEVTSAVNNSAKLEVINPARLINDFNIGFHFETGKTNFQGVKVVFTSAYNSNKTVELSFEREEGDSAKVIVKSKNFSTQGSITSQFRSPLIDSDNFNITYDSTTKKFDVSGFSIDSNELLKGFDDLFYISFEIYGISGASAINISRVVNQKITNNDYDNVRPVVLYGSYKGYYVVGDEVNVNKVNVYDFVDPNPNCVVTLKNASGDLTATNGVKLDGVQNDCNNAYVVKVETIATMTLAITCQDFSYKATKPSASLPLMVKDVVAPTIELNVKKNLYKVGETISVADYVVADDNTAQEKLDVTYYVISPDGSVKYLTYKTFTLDQAGTYRVCYIVRDAAGNSAYANYLIIVE